MQPQRTEHKGGGEQRDHRKADRGHDAEAPEHQRYVGNRVPSCGRDLLRRGGARIGDLALEQQGIAQVALVRFELGARRPVLRIDLQPFHRVIGSDA